MKIKVIQYGKTFNLGNYQTERIDISGELYENDVPDESIEILKGYVESWKSKNTER